MYSSHNGAFISTFGQSIKYLIYLLFLVNYDFDKYLNIFLSFPDQAKPLTLKNKLRIMLGLNPEQFENIEAQIKS